MRDKLEDMMIFPNDVGKDEVMIWANECSENNCLVPLMIK